MTAGVVVVGSPDPTPVAALALVFKPRSLSGSLIGGICETQEMPDFCGEHGIVSEVEFLFTQSINEAYKRTMRSDVRYRLVIDIGSLKG